MSNPVRNKKKGAEWENELKNRFREEGRDIEHLHLAGGEDEGDLVIRNGDGTYLVIEAKNAKMDANTFVREMETEVAHFAAHRGIQPHKVDGVVIVKAYRKPWRKAYVITTVERYFGLDGEK
ncbi:holliday junction resolvase [Streptomyces phage phiScoe10]|nr:holliday junction resolvase [Streptomyces phage phiScoe10]